jgi:hypothetical protein
MINYSYADYLEQQYGKHYPGIKDRYLAIAQTPVKKYHQRLADQAQKKLKKSSERSPKQTYCYKDVEYSSIASLAKELRVSASWLRARIKSYGLKTAISMAEQFNKD